MARPRKQIDPAKVEALAKIGCTVDEIAAVLDCSTRSLQRRFGTVMERGRASMRMSLRRLQLRAAENGNAALLIWLGKQLLDQRDKVDVDVREVDNLLAREVARVSGKLEEQQPASELVQ